MSGENKKIPSRQARRDDIFLNIKIIPLAYLSHHLYDWN